MRNHGSGLTRRNFLKASGGAFAGAYLLGLAGCGGDGAQGGDAELRMSWWGSTERHNRTREAIELFEEENPGISINGDFGGFDAHFEKLATQAAGGNAADVLQMDYSFVSEFGGRGALLDLNQFIGDIINLDDLDDAVLERIEVERIDGAVYQLPWVSNPQAVVYDSTMLDEFGIEMPSADWTWDDFAELASAISEATEEGYYGTENAGGLDKPFEVFVRQKGKETFEDEQLGFGKEDLAEWFSFWEDLRNSGAAIPAEIQSASAAGDLDQRSLVSGQSAMNFYSANQLVAAQELTQSEAGINTYPNGPVGSEPGMFVVGMSLSIYSQTEYPEEAARVINFMFNDRGAIRALGIERGAPISSQIREVVEPELSDTAQKYVSYVEKIDDYLAPKPLLPEGAGEVFTMLARVHEEISFEEITIDEGVNQFFSEAERILG